MATAAEFVKSGIKGQTYREITEKFGQNFTALSQSDAIMANYALGFAWLREKEHLPVPEAYAKALDMSVGEIEAFFEEDTNPDVKKAVDFVSPPPRTTP